MSALDDKTALTKLTDKAFAEMSKLLSKIDVSDPDALSTFVREVVPAIANKYGLAAGTLAASAYEAARAEAGIEVDGFKPVVADVPPQERWDSMAEWIASVDSPDVAKLIQGGMSRSINNVHRETVMQSAIADPKARGWARFGHGETCGFCVMLTSRGSVYDSKTATFASHDHCHCTAAPIWDVEGSEKQVEEYKQSAKKASMSDRQRKAENALVREYLKEHPEAVGEDA